jgi:hypothetical protein
MAGASRMAFVALAALSALAVASALEANQAYAVNPLYDFTTPISAVPTQTVPILSTIHWAFQVTDNSGQFVKAPSSAMQKLFKVKLPATVVPVPGKTSGVQMVKALGDCAKAAATIPMQQSRLVRTPASTKLMWDGSATAYYADLKAPAVKGCYWVYLWWSGVATCRALVQVV